MRKRTAVITIVCAVVVAIGAAAIAVGPTVYRTFFASPVTAAPSLSADDSTFKTESVAELTPEQLDGTWVVTDGSQAGYRVDELLRGEPFTVVGTTSDVTGTLRFENLTLESAQFEVDVASITTDSSQRDSYFRGQALNTATHPTARFELSAPVATSQVPVAGEVVEQTLSGDLTIAGVTQRVTFAVQLRTDGMTTEIVGQIPIAFADFGVEAPSLGFVSVEPTGFVEFSLVATHE
ncbi:MAG: YceI family protein [Leucobacter sp.]|jgi:polyisoprenoid-binding protein YceI|nr:YceI family protein [Leucobacter sp.]